MIYWVCPKPETPSGGVWFIHRLAGLLAERAQVVHTQPFDVWWDTQALPGYQINQSGRLQGLLQPDDVMVVPEVLWQEQKHYRQAPCRKVVFIQNYIWASRNPEDYAGAELVTVSRFLDNWCRRVLGVKPIGMFSPYLEDGPWHTSPKTTDRTLLFARRNPDLAQKVADALSAHDFPVDLVTEPLTQTQIMAEHLADAEFYVHLNAPEGWPMACAEAMRAGTIVCGTTGGGGNEFMFHQETAMVVQDPILGHYEDWPEAGQTEFTRRILENMLILRRETDLRSRLWQQAHNWIGNRYSKARTCEQLKAVFG